MKTIFGAALLALLCGQSAWAWDQQPNHYKVRVDAALKRAHVEADVWIDGKDLVMFGVSPIPALKNGQAEFVENLLVRDMRDQPVALTDKGEGEYELQGDRRVKLSYEVRLEHERYDWPGGLEEVSYRTEEGLMAVAYYLLLVPGEKMQGKTEVEFDLPQGWQAHTPWQATERKNVFVANTRRELVNNAIFLGTAQKEQFKAGGIELSLVLPKRYWPQRAVMKDLIARQMDSYLKMFGGKPLAERYLVIANQGDSGDGGAFAGSFSQYIRADLNEKTRPFWGRVMAHELLHFWNGHSLVPADKNEEWFKEGVTDYLTVTTMARNGLFDRHHVMQFLENLGRGQSVARQGQGLTTTVQQAATDKHNSWLLVYGGGSIAALAMDVELRRASANRQGLPDVMKAMFAQYAKPATTYTHADLLRVVKESSGQDFGPLLQGIVASTKPTDLTPFMAEIGIDYSQYLIMLEHHALPNPSATALQRQRFKDMFGMSYRQP